MGFLSAWSSLAHATLVTQTVDYTADGTTLEGYLAYDRPGRRGGPSAATYPSITSSGSRGVAPSRATFASRISTG